jgi:uncharacterized protein (UPF0335 family)
MYNEAYIPGTNDFDTKAAIHLSDTPTKAAIKAFINGVAKDTSSTVAGLTSPVGIATIAAGGAGEIPGAIGTVAKVVSPLAGTAFAAKGAHDIYTAGTENTSEAWQQRLQGGAMLAGGAATLAEPVSAVASKVSPKLQGTVDTIQNVAQGGQPKLQPAIRGAAQTAAEAGAARPSIELATEDIHPPKMTVDAAENPVDVDGQHRAAQLVKSGKGAEPFTIKYTDAEGATTDQTITADQFLKHINRTPEDILNTDAQQGAVRTGNGQPRQPETRLVGKQTEGAPALEVKPDASMRTVLQDASEDIEGRGKTIYQALDKATDNKFTTYTDRLNKIKDRLDTLIPDTTEADDSAIERLEQQKSEIETSQSQLFENLKQSGIDPKIVDDAKAHWKQSMALRDVDTDLKMSTTGNTKFGEKEVTDPNKFVARLEKRNISRNGAPSRLEQAMGSKEGADALMKDAYEAVKAKRMLTRAKWATGITLGMGILHGDLAHLASAGMSLLP